MKEKDWDRRTTQLKFYLISPHLCLCLAAVTCVIHVLVLCAIASLNHSVLTEGTAMDANNLEKEVLLMEADAPLV